VHFAKNKLAFPCQFTNKILQSIELIVVAEGQFSKAFLTQFAPNRQGKLS
jgi:hypothetical protein